MLITSWDVFLGRTQVTRKVILLGEIPSNVGCCHGSKACWIQKGTTKKIRVDFLEDLLFGDDHLGQKGCWDFRSRGVTQFVIFTSCAGGRRRERSFWWSCRRKDEHENYFSCMWAYAAFLTSLSWTLKKSFMIGFVDPIPQWIHSLSTVFLPVYFITTLSSNQYHPPTLVIPNICILWVNGQGSTTIF